MHYWHGQKELPAACRLENTRGGMDSEGGGGGGYTIVCQPRTAVPCMGARYVTLRTSRTCLLNLGVTNKYPHK